MTMKGQLKSNALVSIAGRPGLMLLKGSSSATRMDEDRITRE
jgi:hypothetical protein